MMKGACCRQSDAALCQLAGLRAQRCMRELRAMGREAHGDDIWVWVFSFAPPAMIREG